MTTYQSNQIGINEIINLYLYGQISKPADLRSESVIRLPGANPVHLDMDAVSFMAAGPGRFANASQIRLVQAFMGGGAFVFPTTGVRQEFNLDQAIAKFGGGKPQNLSILQSNYQDSSNDLLMRAYVYQSSPYTIAKDAVFIIEADGTRHIENFAILPFTDDFDFNSGSLTSNIANRILKPRIDPTDIGRKVEILFTPASKTAVPRTSYTQAGLAADTLRYEATFRPAEGTARVGFAVTSGEYVDGLWSAGVTNLLDANGRAVFHGTDRTETLSAVKFNDLAGYAPLKQAATQNGIAYIGGKGNDTIIAGATNDYLDGGADIDNLQGGAGFDAYTFKSGDGKDTIIDSDGKGSIVVNNTTLTGAAITAYKLVGNKGVWEINSGQTVYTLDAAQKQLVIKGTSLGAGSQITINNFDATRAGGYLGISLQNKAKVVLSDGLGSNFFATADFDPTSLSGKLSTLAEGTGRLFTAYLSTAAKANDTLTLALSGAVSDKFKAVLGNDTLAANGAVIVLKEGQTQVSFALTQEGDITADLAGELSVNYQSAADAADPASGDKVTVWAGIGTTPTDGTEGDSIDGGAGDDAIIASWGDDRIQGGDGDDKLDGLAGNDVIEGDDGDDIINADSKDSHYQLMSCLRAYPLVKTSIRHPKTAKKASSDGHASCGSMKGGKRITMNSVAPCTCKQGILATFGSQKRACRQLKDAQTRKYVQKIGVTSVTHLSQ